MIAFPTLSQQPDYPYKWTPKRPIQKTTTASAMVFTRRINSRSIHTAQITFSAVTAADVGLVEAFEDSVGGAAEIFVWNDPVAGRPFNVRLTADIAYTATDFGLFDIALNVEEV